MQVNLHVGARGAGCIALLGAVAFAGPPATAGTTSPGANGVAKDRGFTISPPWRRGRSFRNGCGYGCGKHDNIGTQDYFAIDWMMPGGEPVYAIAPGRVVLAARLTGGWEPYGNGVMIQHANDYQSFYAHLDSIDVVVGQEVDADTLRARRGRSPGRRA